ncbi:hypothetical protein ACWGLG_28565 [Streptomyces antimycoticus]
MTRRQISTMVTGAIVPVAGAPAPEHGGMPDRWSRHSPRKGHATVLESRKPHVKWGISWWVVHEIQLPGETGIDDHAVPV